MEKLLITGASGLLGANAVIAAIGDYHVTAVCHRHKLAHPDVHTVVADLTLDDEVERVLRDYRPDIILHTAALTDIDRCELDPEAAFLHNRDMPKAIARIAQDIGAYMIQISTDAVFDGINGGYSEIDPPRPINIYGVSKVEAENAVLTHCSHSIVVRTNFFGWNAQEKLSLAEWFLSKLRAGEKTCGFDDVWFSPILVNQLIEILFIVIQVRPEGIYHIAGSECLSKFDFGKRLARAFGFNPTHIQAVSVEKAGLKAQRSKKMCLDTKRIHETLGIELPTIELGLRTFRALHDKGYPQRLKSIIHRG